VQTYVEDFLARLGMQVIELSPQELLQAFYNYLDLHALFLLTDDTAALRVAIGDALRAIAMIDVSPADSFNARNKLLAWDILETVLNRKHEVAKLEIDV
jgi:hypothetical protein